MTLNYDITDICVMTCYSGNTSSTETSKHVSWNKVMWKYSKILVSKLFCVLDEALFTAQYDTIGVMIGSI